MAIERRVLAEENGDSRTIRLDDRAMAELDAVPGDAVVLQGENRTVAGVGEPLESQRGLVATSTVLADAGVGIEDTALLQAATPATRVELAPPESLRFEGVGSTLRDSLAGRAVEVGESVRPSLFDGSLTVRFVVTAVDPSGPAVVSPATKIVVRERPAAPGDVVGQSTRSYDDVAGLEEPKATLYQLVQFPLERPEEYGELTETAPSSVLLTGPPGSGKTLLAEAVGTEAGAQFLRVPHIEALRERYDGGFDELAATAIRHAPTIVLLDDLHEMAPAEGGGADSNVAAIGAFLDAVEGAPVIVIGTTAAPDAVAPSLRRGGRFDHEVELGVPDRDDRLAILRTHLAGVALADGVDLGSVADRTRGQVGADLRALVAAAVRTAVDRIATADEDATRTPRLELRQSDFETALSTVTPSGMRGLSIDQPAVTYGDIGGLEAAKREVIRAVEWPLRYPGLLDRVSANTPTGILLHGLPGTGKTMLAQAVANASDANFLAVQGPELLDRYVGESERGVRDAFDRAERNAPAVLFFDEIDALAAQRGAKGDTDVTERVVSQLLAELDGVDPRQEIVVIGATNRPDIVDPALLRPGRLDRIVEVPLPDREARAAIFRTHAADVPTVGVDFEALAAQTDGYSGSDIRAVVREAGLLAAEDHLREQRERSAPLDPDAVDVRQSHFERAIAVVSPSISEEMRQQYAQRVESMRNT